VEVRCNDDSDSDNHDSSKSNSKSNINNNNDYNNRNRNPSALTSVLTKTPKHVGASITSKSFVRD
jgi:hypothetical protein